MATHIKLVDNNNKNVSLAAMQRHRLNDQERRQLQHEFKIYMEKYFKDKLGKGVDKTKIVIWDDMLVIRGEGFNRAGKIHQQYPVGKRGGRGGSNAGGKTACDRQRGLFLNRGWGATAIHHAYELEPENDFWMHVIVFDRVLTEKSSID